MPKGITLATPPAATGLKPNKPRIDGPTAAVANVRALVAQIRQLSGDLVTARRAAAAAQSSATTARQAYAQNNLDQRTVTDYETTALERRLEVITIERQINEDKIFVAVELGLGLPKVRIALSGSPPS